MSETKSVVVVDASGLAFRARLEPATSYEGDSQTLLQLDDGAQFVVPNELLVLQGDGRYSLNVSLREYAQQADIDQVENTAAVIPVAEETVRIDKRTLRSRVQVSKRVLEREETVDVSLQQEQVEVERVSVNRPVDEPVPVRYEGDTTIIPLYEEVLVVTKQLMLVEEVRVTKRRSERREPQQVTLRREEVTVERGEPTPEGDGE